LLSAVAYELVPEKSFTHPVGVGAGFLVGALTYFFGDRIIDERGGADRQEIDSDEVQGSGAAMFLGALLATASRRRTSSASRSHSAAESASRSSPRSSSPTFRRALPEQRASGRRVTRTERSSSCGRG
jgi:hypothetical protein